MAEITELTIEGAFPRESRVAVNNSLNALNAAVIAAAAAAPSSGGVTTAVATVGVQTILPAAAVDRKVIISVQVTQVFADGDGTQPTLTIGETDTAAKFAAAARFTAAAAGATFSFAGTLSAGKALIATSVAGTGTTETGATAITAIASPQ